MYLTAHAAAIATGGRVATAWAATGLCFDSRQLQPGDLFIALQDERDGHDYVADALAKGAAAAVVSQIPIGVDPARCLIVHDTLTALEALGHAARRTFTGPVVAITGSAGKTTVKEGIKSVLSHFGPTYGSAKNLNNHIGTPFSLAQLPAEARFGIFEVGMNHPGEIRRLVAQVKPHVATINSIYPMHIENFVDLAGIAYAKAEIYEHLRGPEIAIYNADTNHADILAAQAQACGAKSILSFGRAGNTAVLHDLQPQAQGQTVVATVGGTKLSFPLSQAGEAAALNALNILTVCHALGLDVKTAAGHLADLQPLPGRGQELHLNLPTGPITLIDDSYSGQPAAMALALQGLAQRRVPGRRVAILGQMAELGDHSAAEHQKIGQLLATLNLDAVYFVGEPMRQAQAQLPTSWPAAQPQAFFAHKDDLAAALPTLLQADDTVLIKGSRYGSRLFELVEALKTA